MNAGKAFTIIEFLVTMSLIIFLSTVLFLGGRGEQEITGLQRVAFNAVQDIREVQEMAAAIEETDCGEKTTHTFGIYFNSAALPESYILFADCNGNLQKDASDEILREVKIEKTIKVYGLNPSSPLNIVFFPPDPTTSINGSQQGAEAEIVFALKSKPTEPRSQKKVKVNNAGRIEIE